MESVFATGLFMIPWIVPVLAFVGLAVARMSQSPGVARLGERIFFAALLLVAGATLHTVTCNHPFWLMHTSSLALMTIGAVVRGGT